MAQDSLNQITTVIASKYDREQDEPFKRSLEVLVSGWRSTLISRSLEKHPDQRKFFTQTLFVPMSCASRVPCNTPNPPCNVMKSKKPLPQPMRYGNSLFDYVGTVDGRRAFGYQPPGVQGLNRYSKYAKYQIEYEWENQFILLDADTSSQIAMIRVDAVWDDASAIFSYNCNDGACDYWDLPYPVSNDMKQMIIQYINQVDFAKDKTTTPNAEEVEVDPDNPKNPSNK